VTPGHLVLLVLKASLFLMVFAVGLRARASDMAFLLHHPSLLIRSIVSMHVVMPLLVLWSALGFELHPAVKVGLIALALSPVPPMLPSRASVVHGQASYTVGLLTTTAVLSIFFVPLALWTLGTLMHTHLFLPPHVVSLLVGISILLPLASGVVIGHFAPKIANRAAKPLSIIGTVLLVLAAVPLVVDAWPWMRVLIGNGTLVAIILLTLLGLGVGHLFGGPDPDTRSVLGIATATRHPAVAITIAAAAAPSHVLTPSALVLAPSAVLLALIVGALASVPYLMWTKRQALRRSRLSVTSQQRRRSADVSTHQGTPAGFHAHGPGEHRS